MRHLSVLVSFLCCSLSVQAELSLKEIRTTSDNVLVAYYKSDVIKADEVDTADSSLWKLNGQFVAEINKFVTESNACDHHVYLQVPTLVNGTSYTLQTPHGNTTFVFDDKKIFCESIKTNQNAYSALSKVRYANFAIWLGDGGSRKIEGDLPAYTVFKVFTGEQVAQGTLKEIGQDESSGDFVYRIDLSAVPAGGPYKITVKGYGCSYPFGVGGDFPRRLTGDKAVHQMVKDLASGASAYADTYNGAPESFAGARGGRGRDGWLASFFYSYIIAQDRPTDPAVVAQLKAAADKEIGYLHANAYPVGTPMNLSWWGSNVAQGQYAYPCLIYWALTREQAYMDAASQLMDYTQGLNPIGKCYVCGVGFNRVHNPHDRESAYTKEMGWGPRPGILVFGPGGPGKGTSVPDVRSLPRERRFIDNLPSIQWT